MLKRRFSMGLVMLAVVPIFISQIAPPQENEPVNLTEALPAGARISRFEISPDEDYVVMVTRAGINQPSELYSLALQGERTLRRLTNEFVVADGTLLDFQVSQWIVYQILDDESPRRTLYAVPIDGSSAPVLLDVSFDRRVQSGRDAEFVISPDGSTIVYGSTPSEDADGVNLYARSIDGSSEPVLLAESFHSWQLTADGTRVIVRKDSFEQSLLFSIPVADPSAAVGLASDEMRVEQFEATADSNAVIALTFDLDTETAALWRADIGGITAPIQLNDPYPEGFEPERFFLSPDGNWVAVVDRTGKNLEILATDGTVRNRWVFDEVRARFSFTPDSSRLVFRTLNPVGEGQVIYSLEVGGSAEPAALFSTNNTIGSILLTPDSQRLVFRTGDFSFTRLTPSETQLWSVLIDGTAQPILIREDLDFSADLNTEYRVTPDGQTVIFISGDADRTPHLYAAPIDGSAAPITLNLPEQPFFWYRISADGQSLFYTGYTGDVSDGNLDLYQVPLP